MSDSASKFVLDTSIVIDGKATTMVESGEIPSESKIIVPIAALDELQAQASRSREEGFVGLKELTRLRDLCTQKQIELVYSGTRPSMEDIRLARNGRIDAIIRDVAKENNATLLTADYVQALVGTAQGISVRHYRSTEVKETGLRFESFFDENAMSVHLKEGITPRAKKGMPGRFVYEQIGNQPTSREELESIVNEITEAARVSPRGSVEISRSGATVIQLGQYRVAITRPPFSDALEVTIVRPLVRLSLKDYNLSGKLEERFRSKAEGILIAGPPGSGKSTLASSLANFFVEQGKVVKTFESPRDLQVSKEVSQYGPLEGDFEKSAEILLLVRPDYTIFDEVRRTRDFETFADMRLAGVGMVGVAHASDPVNAVQRFMSRMELGMVPHIIDTVIFVKDGRIQQALELNLVVKVPSGMNEPDLARPVVEVKDFESSRLVFEIYTFGEENVVVPVGEGKPQGAPAQMTGIEKLAQDRIIQVLTKFDPAVEVKVISPRRVEASVDESVIPRLIGRGGSQIKQLEQMLSIGIDVKAKEGGIAGAGGLSGRAGRELSFDYDEKKNAIQFIFGSNDVGKKVTIYAGDEPIMHSVIGRKSKIAVPRKSDEGKAIQTYLRSGGPIRAVSS